MAGAVVAIDAGTTGVRAFAVDETGVPLGYTYREFPQYFPRPGWVEHDADEIWDAVQSTLADLRATLDVPVAAIGTDLGGERRCAGNKRTRVEMLAGELRRRLAGTAMSIGEAKADDRCKGEGGARAPGTAYSVAVGVGHGSPLGPKARITCPSSARQAVIILSKICGAINLWLTAAPQASRFAIDHEDDRCRRKATI